MTKVTFVMTVCGVLAMAGCVADREPSTVRNGPQAESPIADAPGGKMPNGTGTATRVIIDDSAVRPMINTVAIVESTSVTATQTTGSIFEFIR